MTIGGRPGIGFGMVRRGFGRGRGRGGVPGRASLVDGAALLLDVGGV